MRRILVGIALAIAAGSVTAGETHTVQPWDTKQVVYIDHVRETYFVNNTGDSTQKYQVYVEKGAGGPHKIIREEISVRAGDSRKLPLTLTGLEKDVVQSYYVCAVNITNLKETFRSKTCAILQTSYR